MKHLAVALIVIAVFVLDFLSDTPALHFSRVHDVGWDWSRGIAFAGAWLWFGRAAARNDE